MIAVSSESSIPRGIDPVQVGGLTIRPQSNDRWALLSEPWPILPRLTSARSLPGEVTIDEVRRASQLLLAIELLVDLDRRPGRLVLTGLSNCLLLSEVRESLVARIECTRVMPLSEAEKERGSGRFVTDLVAAAIGGLCQTPERLTAAYRVSAVRCPRSGCLPVLKPCLTAEFRFLPDGLPWQVASRE